MILAGEYFGRVGLLDHLGESQRVVGPSTAIELLGLNGTPEAGDEFAVAVDEKAEGIGRIQERKEPRTPASDTTGFKIRKCFCRDRRR